MPLPTGPQPDTAPPRSKRGMPLRRRLLISSLLGTIPLILLGVILLLGRYFTLRNVLLQSNLSQSQLAAVYIRGWVEGHIRTLRTLALSQEIQQGTTADIRQLALRQLRAQPDWDNIWVSDATGREIVNTAGQPVSIGDRDYFKRIQRTDKPAVSNIIIGRTTGRRILVIAYPIMRNGDFEGVVAASVRPVEIQRVFSQVTTGEQQTIGLWGSDRRLIARTNTPESMLNEQYASPDADIILSGHSGTGVSVSPITGERVLIGYAPVEIAPWTVVTAVPLAVAVASITRTMAAFIILASLVLAATVAWALYSANILSREVALLADSARAIGAGKLETRVTLHTGGELEDLANSLNKMAADLQVIDRLKSDLLSMVSHELKTPLTSIRTSLELLAAGMVTSDHPRYQDLLDIADRQSRRLQDMIENLLSVARMENGGLAITPRATALAPIIMTSVRQYEEMLKARGLSLTVEVPDDIRVLADSAKITLALNNLLDNAVKFTETGGIDIRAVVADGHAVVSVHDTGIGLTPEVRARLFERFYQAEPLLTRKAGGAGLGLFVAKAIVEEHGGRVFAESPGLGQGSTFGFTLPLGRIEK